MVYACIFVTQITKYYKRNKTKKEQHQRAEINCMLLPERRQVHLLVLFDSNDVQKCVVWVGTS